MRFYAIIAILLVLPQILWAKIHTIARNVATVVDLHDNDEIELVDFPNDWFFSRIVLGVNSVPALQLSGSLVTNDCVHDLHGYYDEVSFAYTGHDKIVYHGPSQNLPVQWWADASPVVPSCRSYAEMTKSDSIFVKLYDFADSVYSSRTKNYRDLGELNSETIFEGSSAKFKILKLPDWFYNYIVVLVESLDGRELDGAVYAGSGSAKLQGYSTKMAVEQKSSFGPTFELAFSEYRKVKLKWWVEVQSPSETKIESRKTDLSADSVEVEYFFGENLYTKSSVKLGFNKRRFVDGRVPEIKKLSFNPQGPKKSKNIWVRGSSYDYKAKLNFGDSVVIAIPLEFNYLQERDSVVVEHFIENENRWSVEPVDSIVGNYAYVKVGHFSSFGLLWFSKNLVNISDPSIALCAVLSESCRKSLGSVVDIGTSIVDRFNNGLEMTYDLLIDAACPNVDKIMNLFSDPESFEWDIEQGSFFKSGAGMIEAVKEILDALREKRKNDTLKKIVESCPNLDEVCMWQQTSDNLDILLADVETSPSSLLYRFSIREDGKGIISSGCKNCEREYKEYIFDDYFMVSSGLVEESAWFVNGMQKCLGVIDITGRELQNYINLFDGVTNLSWTETCSSLLGFVTKESDWSLDFADCERFVDSEKLIKNMVFDKLILDGHEGKLIAISDAMVRISLLAWLRKADNFRYYTFLRYRSTYSGIRSWLELTGPLLDYNNVVIKAYGSIALYEYIHFGKDLCLKMLNEGLGRHYGDNGGFSEGTGYSQYIWDDVPYILAALKDAYKTRGDSFEINEKFLKSPDYMFEFSRPVGIIGNNGSHIKHYGFIPVEVDDGVTYNPDYMVWAKLKNDPKYLAMSKKYPLKAENGKITPLVLFGIPESKMFINSGWFLSSWENMLPKRDSLWGDFKDGIGMITAVKDGDTTSLSMIAENGDLWTRGQAHDQQDNLSITLTSSKKGFLIQDPGYSGFGNRSNVDKFHNYYDHNVLTTDCAQDGNKKIQFSELWSRVYDFTNIFPGIAPSILMSGFEMFSNFSYQFSVEGGEEASVLDKKINEPENGIIGYTATTNLKYVPEGLNCNDLGFSIGNNRTIMYFGENFWVIDRPVVSEDYKVTWKWLANSPMSDWGDMLISGVHLYNSAQNEQMILESSDAGILQNGSRLDFVLGADSQNYLQNYKYVAYDVDAKTYVMNYALGEDAFVRDTVRCPAENQCFRNGNNTLRIVVPPFDGFFELCDALPKVECFGNARSTGITMFKKNDDKEWMTRWVLDGQLYVMNNAYVVSLTSATVSRDYYVYKKTDGSELNDRYKGPYLPALPILLLR